MQWTMQHSAWIDSLKLQTVIWRSTGVNIVMRRSQWPRGLRRGSATARLLGLRVRIPSGTWTSVTCQCCVLSEVSASGWSLAQRSPTECGVSVCDREGPRPLEAAALCEKKHCHAYDCVIFEIRKGALLLQYTNYSCSPPYGTVRTKHSKTVLWKRVVQQGNLMA